MTLSLHIRRLLPITLALGLLVACDDSDPETDAGGGSEDAGGRGEDAGGGGEDAGDGEDAGEPGTIVDIAAGNSDFSILVAAVTRADLVDTLAGAGPFTVFAPTNAAFEAAGITEADIETIPVDQLTQILTYHVVGAAVPAAEVPNRAASLATNEYGDNLTLLFDTTSGVVINGSATVTTADVSASNGIVHVIDAVLSPLNVVTAAEAAGLTGLLTAVTTAAPLPDGTTLADALAAPAPYTVFAPTNAAFEAISGTTLTPEALRDVLLYHVLDPAVFTDPVLAADLPTEVTELATLNGATATLDPTATPPTIEGAGIVATDLVVTNGVVHVIDAVILPPAP